MQWKSDPMSFKVPIAKIVIEPDQAPCVLNGLDDHDHFMPLDIIDEPMH
jgi:hypothetical protein